MKSKNRLPKGIGTVSKKIHRSPSSRGQIKRWENARLKKKVYLKLTGKEENLKTFSNKDNPLDNNIHTYDVSAQVNYESGQGGIYSKGDTFQIISYDSLTIKDSITDKTKQSYSSMTINGDNFSKSFQRAIKDNTTVSINRVRGMEKTNNNRLNKSDYENLLRGQVITKNHNSNISFSKNKKGRKIGKYDGKLDLTHFR